MAWHRERGRQLDAFFGAHPLAATADASVWRELRDLWHDRLDVKVFSVSYAWVVATTALLPLAWLIGLIRLCECVGRAIARTAATTSRAT